MADTASHAFTGVQKSAILCLALGPKEGARLLEKLTAEEVEAISREIMVLPSIEVSRVQRVLEEYQAAEGTAERAVEGGVAAARQLLRPVLGDDRAEALLKKLADRDPGSRLAELDRMEPRLFASVLLDEHPQTIAVILAHLDLKKASRAVTEFPPDLAAEVLLRMARMDKIAPQVLAILDEGLKKKTDLSLSQGLATPGDPARVAKLLTMTGGGRDQELLAKMEQRDKEIASRIRSLMFVFEDLLLVDGKGVQRVLQEVDGKDLSLALKGASPELRQHVKSNMSARAATALDEEVELLGAVRVRDVEAAQQRIMERVRELETDGQIVVRREGGNDEFIA